MMRDLHDPPDLPPGGPVFVYGRGGRPANSHGLRLESVAPAVPNGEAAQ